MDDIRKKIMDAADKRGLNRKQLADESGVAHSNVYRFLRGENITTDLLEKIAATLGMKIDLKRIRKGG